jgi:copper resistance protein D
VTGLLVAARSIHLGSVTLLVGALSFLVLVARPVLKSLPPGTKPALGELEGCFLRLATGSLIAAVSAAFVWLALQAVLASELPLERALGADALGTLLTRTHFGHVWILRGMLMALLGGFLIFREREQDNKDWLAARWQTLVLAVVLGASVAFAGHAAATEGDWAIPNLAADAVHVVATGIWLGGLLPLFVVLTSARRHHSTAGDSPRAGVPRSPIAIQAAATVTRRFSALALGAVATLIASGLVNAYVQVGSIPRLVGTAYGRLLLVKLVLFGCVVSIGAVNRLRLVSRLREPAVTPDRLCGPGGPDRPAASGWRGRDRHAPGTPSSLSEMGAALGRLRRNVAAEMALGGVILVIASALAVTPPARHLQPSWPFGFRLSWAATGASPQTQLWLGAGGLVVAAGVGLLALAWLRRDRRRWAVPLGLAIVVYGGWLALSPMAIDAYPTTYLRPTIAYQAASIARGAELYRRHCVSCHGVAGYGDGPAARALPKDPADLTAKHAADHTAGDFFWWLSHGIPKSGMPGFARELDEEQRWDVINFVRALAAAETARFLTPSVSASRPVVAPDFSFGIGVGPSQTLRDHRGWALVHLVFFTLPPSLARLTQVDAAWSRIGFAGARVIAVPMREAEHVYRALGLRAVNFPIAVEGGEEITQTYALFRRTVGSEAEPPPLSHAEFLIDRQGYIRARWLPGSEPGWAEVGRLLEEIERLDKEGPRAPPPEEHVH